MANFIFWEFFPWNSIAFLECSIGYNVVKFQNVFDKELCNGVGNYFSPSCPFLSSVDFQMACNCSSELLQRARLRFVSGCLMQFDILEKEEWEVVIIHYLLGTFQRKKQLLPNTKRCLSWSQTRRKQDHLLALWDCFPDDVVSRKTGMCMAEEVQVVPWVLHGLAELFWTMIHCPFSWQKINFPVLERNMYIYVYVF